MIIEQKSERPVVRSDRPFMYGSEVELQVYGNCTHDCLRLELCHHQYLFEFCIILGTKVYVFLNTTNKNCKIITKLIIKKVKMPPFERKSVTLRPFI